MWGVAYMYKLIEKTEYCEDYLTDDIVRLDKFDRPSIYRKRRIFDDVDHKHLACTIELEPIDIFNYDASHFIKRNDTVIDIGNLEFSDDIITFIDLEDIGMCDQHNIARYHVNPIERLIGFTYVHVFGCDVKIVF